MPSNHYRCPVCGTVVLLTCTVAKMEDYWCWPPVCDNAECVGIMEFAPQPGDFTLDLKSDGGGDKGFQKFTVHRLGPDGQQHEETIDSLHKLRRIEADSEQRYKDGEGEPLRFRGYSQDRSNLDQNAFGASGTIGDRTYSSGEAPQKKKNIDVRRHGTTKPTVKVARGAGKSPLKGFK